MSVDAQGVEKTPLQRALGRDYAQMTSAEGLSKKSRPGEEFIRALLLFCGVVSIFTTIGIVVVLGRESLLFLNAEAWLPNKLPLVNEDANPFTLDEPLALTDTQIAVRFQNDADRRAFLPGRFMQIGDEIMLIEAYDGDVLTVQRAQRDTVAVLHPAEATVLPMVEVQIRTVNALVGSPDALADAEEENASYDTIMLESEQMANEYFVGQRVRIGTSSETMIITEINGNELVVERGVEELGPTNHPAGEQVSSPDAVRLGEFFTNRTWSPTLGEFGITPLVTATLLTSFIAMLVAIPLGLGAAIYLSEYARPELRKTLKPILEILAGVPTVVYGYFAIQFMTPLLQFITPQGMVGVYNMASAGIVMGIMILPTISSMSEDALSAVPRSLREASYGLGGTRLETTLKVVFPAALSGVLAAFIVGISRAVGETMIVAIAAGGRPNFTLNPFAEAETMTGHIVRISKGDLSYNSVEYNSIFAIGITLFVITLTLNLVSGWIVKRFREAY